MSDAQPEVLEVHLVDYPLDLYLRAQEHADDLIRELTLIANSPAVESGHSDLPARLLVLVDQLTHQYAGVSDDVEKQRDAALDRGETSIDLTYRVPREIADAVRHLGDIFDEADEYCRQGEHLLTLATPADALAYRHWLLEEFVAQIEDGRAPMPWSRSPYAQALQH
ncbi:hypothetical protein [Angustibacter sp. Root456]|uniref:hypothetical protein n=1 Tax=Angustibacter sp. Root456 TaxID=1736539 RepID=UPI0006F7EE7B|nr:hypothetical protein [Angustibacter sp. Root456]KQX66278.1 hypothetical protein ASD06_07980 [Angustibacter sp. Root456]